MRFQFHTKNVLMAVAVIALALGTLRASGQSMFAATACLFVILPIVLFGGVVAGEVTYRAVRKNFEKWFAVDESSGVFVRIGVDVVASVLGLFIGIAAWAVGIIGFVMLIASFEIL